jgi:hypothetical protein
MPRKPAGDHALTPAERQARRTARKAAQFATTIEALKAIQAAKTLREAKEIAGKTIAQEKEAAWSAQCLLSGGGS